MDASRFDIMDAQRYDLSKRRLGHSLSITTHFSKDVSGHDSLGQNISAAGHQEMSSNSSTAERDPLDLCFFADHECVELPIGVDQTSAPTTISESSCSSEPSSSSNSPLSSSPSITFTSSNSSITSGDSLSANTVRQTDVFTSDQLTITRTIIRPTSRAALLNYLPFSRPCTPSSRPSSPIPRPPSPVSGVSPPITRPTSPIARAAGLFSRSTSPSFGSLNCVSANAAFEIDVDQIQESRKPVEVWVTQEVHVHHEDLWTSATCERSDSEMEGIRRRCMETQGSAEAI